MQLLISDPHTHTQSKVAKLTSRLYARGAGGKRECATVCATDGNAQFGWECDDVAAETQSQ